MNLDASHDTDVADLATHGYRQRLHRGLGSFSSFAAGFSYISILTGMFQLFGFGYGFGGPSCSGPGSSCWPASSPSRWCSPS